MSDINALRAQLRQLEARNRELRGYMSELNIGVSSAERRVSDYQNKVKKTLKDSNDLIDNSHNNIIRAHEIQAEIDKLYVGFKNMELANKKIRACNNKKYYDFANYATVRKIVQGMLDNLEQNIISDAVIYKAIEKKHLQTPDYWLTSVLISVMAWRNDDSNLAERAMEISIKLDKKNSAIFYMLFNLRMGREEAALKWFMLYQECELKGSDQKTFLMLFSLLSKTVKDNVEDKVKYEVFDFINKVIAMNAKAEGFDEQKILNMIERNLARMKKADNSELHMLKRCLVDYAEVADILMSAENNIAILQFVMDVNNVSEAEKNAYLAQFINDQIKEPNEVERSVYDEIELNELIIDFKGNVEKANEVYNERQKKKQKELNLISEMISWIYGRNTEEEVNGQIRKNMFTLTLGLQKKGIEQYKKHYRSRVKDTHPVVIGDYATEADFRNRQGESKKIETYYEAEKQSQLSQIKYIMAIVGAVLAAAGVVGAFYMGAASLVISAAGIILAIINVVSNNLQKKQILKTCELNINSKNELMDQLFTEYQLWKEKYEEYDGYCSMIENTLEQF